MWYTAALNGTGFDHLHPPLRTGGRHLSCSSVKVGYWAGLSSYVTDPTQNVSLNVDEEQGGRESDARPPKEGHVKEGRLSTLKRHLPQPSIDSWQFAQERG